MEKKVDLVVSGGTPPAEDPGPTNQADNLVEAAAENKINNEINIEVDPQAMLARVRLLEEQLQVEKAHVQEYSLRLQAQAQELEEANARLAALAVTDGLTGLKNHRAFQEFLEQEHLRAQAFAKPLTLIMMDLDAFKKYNDTFGHHAGDEVLKVVANLLLRHTRNSDFVARYGGEEFVLVLPDTDLPGAHQLAENCRAALEAIPWLERPVTASFGVAIYPTMTEQPRDAATLVAHADLALFHAKRLGRNRVSSYEEVPRELHARALTDALRTLADRVGTGGEATSERQQMEPAYDATITAWSRILDMRDHETEGHSERVTEMTVRLARVLGMSEEDTIYARWGALLHDIGKMGVPDNILRKPGPLTEAEWEVMRRHPQYAYEMLSSIDFLNPALAIPWCHHEQWDGSGYPHGLTGEQIPMVARIFAVVDVYDALRSDRPYREGWPEQQVRDHIRARAGAHFDPVIVASFLRMLETESCVQSLTQDLHQGVTAAVNQRQVTRATEQAQGDSVIHRELSPDN